MKTTITKLLAGICLVSSVALTTGCIEETFPTSGATEEQVTSSEESATALLWAMHSILNEQVLGAAAHYDWGYGSVMHVRDVMTGDMPIASSGYDHYQAWEQNVAIGEGYMTTQFLWYVHWKAVLATNKLLAAYPEEEADDVIKGYIGAAHAYRAMLYLDMARMFEYLPTDVTDPVTEAGNDVTNYTVPIVTEATTQEESYNNPRVKRDEMAAFILSDLDKAEELIPMLTIQERTMPHLDVVYGLKARLYMWMAEDGQNTDIEAYRNAQKYARMAIDASKLAPMTEEECLSTTKGFNDISCWMWGSQLVKENTAVQTGIVNWVSWMCNENTFGYTAQQGGPTLMIDAKMYSQIDNNDFRKRMWVPDSQTSPLWDKVQYCTSAYGDFKGSLPAYASVKFRPGEGNPDDVNLAASIAYPLMRVEEMYFIEAEAAEHVSPGTGKQLLEDFMNNYRIASDAPADYKYTCTATDVIQEIVFQKRVELWGEGHSFFDYKRLNMSVDRTYAGSNFYSLAQFKTAGRPAWMNICIVQLEKDANRALLGWENPDPSDKY